MFSQILDYYPVTDREEVVIFDAARASITANTKRWRVPEDLVDFPIVSSAQVVTIRYTVRGIRSGRLAFAVMSRKCVVCGISCLYFLPNQLIRVVTESDLAKAVCSVVYIFCLIS